MIRGDRPWTFDLEEHRDETRRELAQRRRAEAELRDLRKMVADLSAREKRQIGREPHDSLGQQLTGASMLAKSLERCLTAVSLPELATRIAELLKTLQEAHTEVRRLVKGLCPVEMDSLDLMTVLETLVLSLPPEE